MTVTFVCSGNTCRSPFAEGYFNSLKLKNIFANSRGLSQGGMPASENSRIIAKKFGFSLENHTSSPIGQKDFESDYIFTMSSEIRDFLIQNGFSSSKVFVLGNGIFDPYGYDIEFYESALTKIADEIDKLVFGGFFGNAKIKPMNQDDIKKIAKLEEKYFSEPWSESSIIESSKNNTVFFTALENEDLIGYVGLNFILDEGYITSIAVEENSRNKGVAALLLNRCFSFAREKKLSFVSLEVRQSNQTAVALYQKLGFNLEGQRKDFYKLPRENANIMTRRFLFNADTCD